MTSRYLLTLLGSILPLLAVIGASAALAQSSTTIAPQAKRVALEPLADGTYRAERGYAQARASCPAKIDIAEVKISAGTIEFMSEGSRWFGMIDEKTGNIRIETTGITPRPTAPLSIRGHYSKAQLFSTVCGVGYFRVIQ